jgi:hypothetical protein
MSLTTERLERLQRSLELALNQEWPQLRRTQRTLAKLRPTPIATAASASSPAIIATVATDGGENRLSLEPIRLQMIRVADSEGEVYFEDFIPQSLTPEEMVRFHFQSEPRLQRFLAFLGVEWGDLIPRSDFERSNLLAMLRELMEWAALMKLASQPPPKLLIRDGLLRSVLLKESVFRKLRQRFEELTGKHDHLLVGVAKRSRVISYLSVALGLNASFSDAMPAYLEVPADLEKEAAPSQYRWIGDRAMGCLHIARLDRGAGVPLLPVDVAAWQADRVGRVMTPLHESARGSFPLRGYPRALVQAHAHARLGGLEIEMLERMLLQELASRDPATARQAQRLKLLGRQLIEELQHDQVAQS